jgi:hypothetical protein
MKAFGVSRYNYWDDESLLKGRRIDPQLKSRLKRVDKKQARKDAREEIRRTLSEEEQS